MSEFLERFTFEWKAIPGRTNAADPLSRRPDLLGAMLTRAAARQPAPARASESGGGGMQPVAATTTHNRVKRKAHDAPATTSERKRQRRSAATVVAPLPAHVRVPEETAASEDAPPACEDADMHAADASLSDDLRERIRLGYEADAKFHADMVAYSLRHEGGMWYKGLRVAVRGRSP